MTCVNGGRTGAAAGEGLLLIRPPRRRLARQRARGVRRMLWQRTRGGKTTDERRWLMQHRRLEMRGRLLLPQCESPNERRLRVTRPSGKPGHHRRRHLLLL